MKLQSFDRKKRTKRLKAAKTRRKMTGRFRDEPGRDRFRAIRRFIETCKRGGRTVGTANESFQIRFTAVMEYPGGRSAFCSFYEHSHRKFSFICKKSHTGNFARTVI